ncbi:hypothetical protein [Mesorhizobium sp. dw_380]|uniref:hypothetical protein n=1 Tax=Mesorhizobium sp. dw_380 TaxID=2812001 RepID=UPI001BDE0F5A|nr:hypothetical protein [Mesorhizobium sp. dw_380]
MNAFAAANITAPILPLNAFNPMDGEFSHPQGSTLISANITARPEFSIFADWHAVSSAPRSEPKAWQPITFDVALPFRTDLERPFRARLLLALLTRENATSRRLDALKIRDRLASYAKYESRDWDGFDADPISAGTRKAATNFLAALPRMLSAPEIAPGTDGTIALEWLWNSGSLRKLFIDIGPGNVWKGYWRRMDGQSGILPPKPIATDSLKFDLASLVRRLNS